MRHALAIAAVLLLSASATSEAQRIGRRNFDDVAAPTDTPATVTIARALDKVTARITELELPSDRPVIFGSLEITARHCYSRPPEETPESFAFLEVDELLDNERKRIFTGWMLASSPALHALEHPIYDVWIVGCRTVNGEGEG